MKITRVSIQKVDGTSAEMFIKCEYLDERGRFCWRGYKVLTSEVSTSVANLVRDVAALAPGSESEAK